MNIDKSETIIPFMKNIQRQICYAIGVVAYRLIEVPEETERNPIRKLNILQGGIEHKFFSFLAEDTKTFLRRYD